MAHQHLARAKTVAVRASGRRVGDPRPGRRLHQLAQHILKPTTEHPAAAAGLGPPNSNTGSSVLVCIGRHRMIIGYEACHLKPRNGGRAGETARAIAGRADVAVSSHRGVLLAVQRAAAAAGVEQLEAAVGDSYQAACQGDARAAVQLRRALGLLAGLHQVKEEPPVPDLPQPVKQLQRFQRDPKFYPKARRRR